MIRIKNVFETVAEMKIKCEICGGDTVNLYGCGWDNDRIYCCDDDCGAEYVFPTSTELQETDSLDEIDNEQPTKTHNTIATPR